MLNKFKVIKFTKEELILRAYLSNKNIEDGEVYSLEEIKEISKNW